MAKSKVKVTQCSEHENRSLNASSSLQIQDGAKKVVLLQENRAMPL